MKDNNQIIADIFIRSRMNKKMLYDFLKSTSPRHRNQLKNISRNNNKLNGNLNINMAIKSAALDVIINMKKINKLNDLLYKRLFYNSNNYK